MTGYPDFSDDDRQTDLYDPSLYINREMSWLGFNRRCLRLADDPSVPLLERVKFLAICYGNIDEFFTIRIPGMVKAERMPYYGPDMDRTDSALEHVLDEVQSLADGYSSCWDRLRRDLAAQGIRIHTLDSLSAEQTQWIEEFYRSALHPVLTPLAMDVSHPFPFISNDSLNLAVRLIDAVGSVRYARVKVPVNNFPRFVQVPSEEKGLDFVKLEDIMRHSIYLLFPGLTVSGVYYFNVKRNADVKVTIDEACDMMSAVEESIEDRDMGFPVGMMVDDSMPAGIMAMFGRNLNLTMSQIIKLKDAIRLVDLWQIAGLDRPELKEPCFEPSVPPEFAEGADVFRAIRTKDWIFYYPFESFSSTVMRFLNAAADDNQVRSIKICLYRIGKDPSLVNALKRAWENGKSVSVLMEVRAKFDESMNIKWARELESMGVHVVFGPVDLKVHSKLLQVVREEDGKMVRYTHMSSGNYNTSSSKQYCDLSYFTANQEIGQDVGELFNALTGFFGPRQYKHLLVSPVTLKPALIDMIRAEAESHRVNGNGYIAFKANGLVDSDIIAELYRASIAGVRIDLNIRGLCCLRPGVPGISDNIRVTSIVDRFLEHARIYYFNNNGDPKMYMGSSDLMPRNLIARVETLFPVLDPKMLRTVRDMMLKVHLSDNVKAMELRPDGTYEPVKRLNNEAPFRSQQVLIDNRGVWNS